MKKLVSCLLILAQMIGLVLCSSAYAGVTEADVTLRAVDYDETNVPEERQYQNLEDKYGFGLSTNEYILFAVNVSVSGEYRLSSRMGVFGDKISFWVDGYLIEETFVSTGGFNEMNEVEITTLMLREGVHSVKVGIRGIPEEGCQFYSLTLTRLGDIDSNRNKIVEAEHFSALYDTTPSTAMDEWCDENEVYHSDGFMLVLDGEWMVYHANLSKGGRYALHFNQKVEWDNLQLRITADGQSQDVSITSNDRSLFLDYFICYLDLAAGVHEIKVEMLSGNGFLFDRMELIWSQDLIEEEINIDPDAYIELSGGTADKLLVLPETAWVKFLVNACYSGYYRLRAEVAAESATTVGIFVNGAQATELLVGAQGSTPCLTPGYVYLQKGNNEIRLEALRGKAVISELLLTALQGIDGEGFATLVREINRAASEEDVEKLLDTYFPLMGESKQSWLKNIFYPEPIFADFMQRNFSDIGELMRTWYSSVQSEKNKPRVALRNQNGELLTELETGNLTVQVKNDRSKGNFNLIAAVYQDGKLHKLVREPCEGKTNVLLPLDGLNIPSGAKMKFRLFYWNSLSDLCPLEAYDNIYLTIHLSPSGDDKNGDGSSEKPYYSIARAKEDIARERQRMSGDIVVSMAGGEYSLNETQALTELHGGENGYRIIWKGEDRANPPVLSGGIPIMGWREEGGLWSAAVGATEMRSLYINGRAARRARSQFYYEAENVFKSAGSSYVADGMVLLKSRFPALSAPENLELVWDIQWTCQRLPVERIEEQEDKWLIYMKQPHYHYALTKEYELTTPTYKKPFYVENAKEFLDEPGEFYFSRAEGRVYYYPLAGENPNQCEIYYPSTEQLVTVKGESGIVQNCVFDNIVFRYGAWNGASNCGVVGFQADKIVNGANDLIESQGAVIPSQFVIENAENIVIQNCRFESFGSGAISMMEGVSDAKICGNVICDTAGTGIIIGSWDHDVGYAPERLCKNIDVTNNVLTRNSYEYRGGTAISVYYADAVNISHNNISHTPYSAISVGWGWGADVERFGNIYILDNRIEHVMFSLNDGGHIYTLGTMEHAVIRGNYLKKSYNPYYGGIYCDSGSSDIEVSGNVVEESYLWFMQGMYLTHNLRVHDNYSDSEHYVTFNTEDGNSIFSASLIGMQPLGYEKLIKNRAGVLPEYSYLLRGIQTTTEWVDMQKTPKIRYADGTIIEAEDFMKGGEGIGYHKVEQGNNDGIYRPDGVDIYMSSYPNNFLVGNTVDGEWLKYELKTETDADYCFELHSSAVEVSPMIDLYVDGALIAEGVVVPQRESWDDYSTVTLGSVALSAGTHEFQVVFRKGGCSLDYFIVTNR